MSKGWGEGTPIPFLDGSCDGLEFFLARLQRTHVRSQIHLGGRIHGEPSNTL